MADYPHMCGICLYPCLDTLKCGHPFHTHCIAEWASSDFYHRGSCPTCRKSFKKSAVEFEAIVVIQRKWRDFKVFQRYACIKKHISSHGNHLLKGAFNALVFNVDDSRCSRYKDHLLCALRNGNELRRSSLRQWYTFYTVSLNEYGFVYYRDSPNLYDFRTDFLGVPFITPIIVKALIDDTWSMSDEDDGWIIVKGERFLPKCELDQYKCQKCGGTKWRSYADAMKCCESKNTSMHKSNNIMRSKKHDANLKRLLHVDYKYNKDDDDDFINNNIVKITYDEADNTKLRLPVVTNDFKRFFKKQKWQSSKPRMPVSSRE